MFNNPFYFGIIRKTVVAFGQLFSNIYIERRQGDSVNGTKTQTLIVPITYAPKEKYLVRLEQDPTLEQHTHITMPRMSFEVIGYQYDSQRKLAKMNRIACNDGTSSKAMFTPVPYNIDFALYILTKTQEDALQIIEQILPNFGPEYSLTIKAVPSMNIVQDIPITINSVNFSDEYDGNFDKRTVIHTLNFNAKINLYNSVNDAKPIYTSIANVAKPDSTFTAIGDPETQQVVSEDWEY